MFDNAITIITSTLHVNRTDIHDKGLLQAKKKEKKKSAILKSTLINLCNIANDNNYYYITNILSSSSCLMICIHPISKNTAKH